MYSGQDGRAAPASARDWRFCVAPMMGCTDRHARYLMRLLTRRARLYTEMIHANAVVHGDRERLLGFDPAEHPVALQLGGSEPKLLADAARIGADRGYDEINLNVGCPSPRVQKGRFGARLMAEPMLVAQCVAAMRAAVKVPVTVKTRIGIDHQDNLDFLLALVEAVVAAGCDVVMVHARKAWLSGLSPRENRDVPPLDYDRARAVKTAFPDLPVIVNGGIDSLDTAAALLERFDGVMLGRAVYHRLRLLERVDQAIFGEPAARDLSGVLAGFAVYLRQQVEAGVPARSVLRHVLGIAHGLPGARRFRRVLSDGMSSTTDAAALFDEAVRTVQWMESGDAHPVSGNPGGLTSVGLYDASDLICRAL